MRVICVRDPGDGERELYLEGAYTNGGIAWTRDVERALHLPHSVALALLWFYQRGLLYTRRIEA
jgi:hypothetical protein